MSNDHVKQTRPTPPISASGLKVAASRHSGSFKEGNPGGPGRPKGLPNRIKADLSQMIINNAARAGFLELKDGENTATGIVWGSSPTTR
jgi:hypothetical protein